MIKQIPNMITSLNILSGALAVLFASTGDLVAAALFVFLGIFFDFFDGFAARLLKAQSEVGLQLDSLADVITSGLAPAIVMVQLLYMSFTGSKQSLTQIFSLPKWHFGFSYYIPIIGLIIVVAAAYRLAKFNVDTRQSDGFIGLPTPANALLVMSLPLILEFQYTPWAETMILNPWFLIGVTLLGSILMNSELALFSLKMKTLKVKDNLLQYAFLLISLLLIFSLYYWAIPAIILVYLILSIGNTWKQIL